MPLQGVIKPTARLPQERGRSEAERSWQWGWRRSARVALEAKRSMAPTRSVASKRVSCAFQKNEARSHAGNARRSVKRSGFGARLGLRSQLASSVTGRIAPVAPSLERLRTAENDVTKKCQRNVTSKALPKDVDWNAIGTYILSTALQFTLIVVTLKALDFLIPQIPWSGLDDLLPERDLPTKAKNAFTFLFFLFMSFRSRFFSPMDNRRPQVEEVRERKMPSWMPPPAAFPIIWGAIGLLRSASAFLIWKALGETYVVLPIVLFMLHLCVGDTWNTINNVEKRYGTAGMSSSPPSLLLSQTSTDFHFPALQLSWFSSSCSQCWELPIPTTKFQQGPLCFSRRRASGLP